MTYSLDNYSLPLQDLPLPPTRRRLTPDIEQTALEDEPKDCFIKTADFGDDCDRVLQHRDGEFTQLLEDIARYHQIFQQGYDKIILLRPPSTRAMTSNSPLRCNAWATPKSNFNSSSFNRSNFTLSTNPPSKSIPSPTSPPMN